MAFDISFSAYYSKIKTDGKTHERSALDLMMSNATLRSIFKVGSEEAEASVCPQNRAYGSVHGSSHKTYPLRNFKPML